MTVPEASRPQTSVAVIPTATSTKVHSFVRQNPVSVASFQASQQEHQDSTSNASGHSSDHNGRVSVQPTSFEGGLLVGLYDPHLGPQCAEYLQQHLVPILDESLSTQLDHEDTPSSHSPNNLRIDPHQVIDTLKSTFLELDELLLATAITVALAQPDDTELASEDEMKKTQEVLAQVVTGSTALVGFLAPHNDQEGATSSGSLASLSSQGDQSSKHDFYLAQLGDSVAILAGLDAEGQWTARRLNPPETDEHSVRYQGSEEYRKVILEARERTLTAEQFLSQHHDPAEETDPTSDHPHESFLTRGGRFLGLPVTRAFGDLDWKIEQEPRFSVAAWVEKSLRAKIDAALGGGQEAEAGQNLEEMGINNLHDPPYVAADPKITRFVLETRKAGAATGSSDQFLVLLNRGLLYSSSTSATASDASSKVNQQGHALVSDYELSRIVALAVEKEENGAQAVAKALDHARKEAGVSSDAEEGQEGSVLVIVL